MKKIALIIGLFTFSSCESIKDVISPAEITASMSLTQTTRGRVYLQNLSKNGGPCTVDWGDGKSDDFNAIMDASHTYNSDGVFEIKMTVYNSEKRTKEKTETKTITISNTEGDVVIWLNADPQENKVVMGIDGVIVGYPTKFVKPGSTVNVDCDTDVINLGFGIKKALKPGKHTYEAYSIPNLKSKWSGTFEVTNNSCTKRRLVD
jgi:PKD repeat protein